MELFIRSCLVAQHTALAQGTLLTTVKWPDLMPSWSRCWPQKAWSLSTDTIQTPVGLIHTHVMHNWGPSPKIFLSEAGDMTNSMVMWLILTGIWMTILELIWGRLCNKYAAWCFINLFRSLKDSSTIIRWKYLLVKLSIPSNLATWHTILERDTLLITVK